MIFRSVLVQCVRVDMCLSFKLVFESQRIEVWGKKIESSFAIRKKEEEDPQSINSRHNDGPARRGDNLSSRYFL